MDVRVDVAIPMETAAQIKSRLDRLREDLMKKIEATERKIKAGKPEALAERKALVMKLNRLSSNNLIRLTTILGAAALGKLSDADLFDRTMDVGLVRGRKKHAA